MIGWSSALRGRCVAAARGAGALLATDVVSAQDLHLQDLRTDGSPPATLADLAVYAGADRTELLVAGARAEGSLTLYTSATTEDMNVIATLFEQFYGVKVKYWRASNEDILQRGVMDKRAGRNDADVYETDGSGLEGLRREGLLQPAVSPLFADLMPQAIAPGDWIGTRLNVISAAYNTSLLRPEDLPHSYADLVEPKWKGKLGIEAGDSDWFATIVSQMGEDAGLALFRDIMAKNGATVRKGHSLMANLVAAGEVPLALTTYFYKDIQLQTLGAPVEAIQLMPTVARVNGIALAVHAQHPHAALLFFDFMLGVGQKILADRQLTPTNLKAQPPGLADKLTLVNSAQMFDEGAKWDKLFNEIVVRQSR